MIAKPMLMHQKSTEELTKYKTVSFRTTPRQNPPQPASSAPAIFSTFVARNPQTSPTTIARETTSHVSQV